MLWDATFFLGSLVPALLVGVALGNVVRGVPMDARGNCIGGFFDLLNPYALLFGVTGLALIVSHGVSFLAVKTEGELPTAPCAGARRPSWCAPCSPWPSPSPPSSGVSRASHNVFSRPIGWFFLVLLVVALVYTLWQQLRGPDFRAFLGSAVIIVALAGIAAVSQYPDIVPRAAPRRAPASPSSTPLPGTSRCS